MRRIIKLSKIGNNKKELIYEVTIDNNNITYIYGQKNGKLQTEEETINEGKNIGKANETSPAEQALFEAERKVRKKIENGYSIINGYKLSTVSKTVVESNIDIPSPMLAKTYKDQEKQIRKKYSKVDIQYKLNGNRCIVNIKTKEMYSRKRKQITSIPNIIDKIVDACKNINKDIIWVDGELYSKELTFNEIQSIIRQKNQVSELASKIKYNIFDVMSKKEWKERKKYLDKIVTNERVNVLKTFEIDINEIEKYNQQFVKDGYEGVIIRLPDYSYEQKRSSGLIKYKTFIDEEFKVIGFVSEKNNPLKLGSIKLIMKNGNEFNARPSMTDEECDYIWTHQEEFINKYATVEFQNYDEVTGLPVFGTIKGFRDSSDI
jgi:DNA ligase-1